MASRRTALRAALLGLLALTGAGCRPPTARPPAHLPGDSAVLLLPLAGPAATDSAEISGMAWDGDRLLLLPQYPHRFAAPGEEGALFWLPRAELERAADAALRGGATPPLQPRAAPVVGLRRAASLPGYEGFEALAVSGPRVYLTVESTVQHATTAFLAAATLRRDPYRLQLDTVAPAPVRPRPATAAEAQRRTNFGDEALLLWRGEVLTLHEVNGRALSNAPHARRFGLELEPRGELPLPNVEFRVTDATAPDARGRFWVVNYFYPGEPALRAADDPLARCAGRAPDPTHRAPVERLLEMRVGADGIRLTGRTPRYLAPPRAEPNTGYNWEAVARLKGRGLLVATDRFPRTALALVPLSADPSREPWPGGCTVAPTGTVHPSP